MTDHIIELSDRNVRVLHREDGVLAQSPGFANIASGQPVFGDEARGQYRLHPRQSFNQFWSLLSLDPLANTKNHFRHQADVAYKHLTSLVETCQLDSDVIFVIPSNYNRQQLAILLGLVKQCPFDATGLIDLAVAATAGVAESDEALYVDVQLHQTVLTRLVLRDGRLQRDTVLQIPGTGLLALNDAWANMITDAFIKQSRFDPLHNAETEQYIYNEMSGWIDAARKSNEVLLEINHKGSVHQAKLNRGYFEQRARTIFTRVKQELDTLAVPDSQLFVAASLTSLPGLALYVPGLTGVDEDNVAANCFKHLALIEGDPASLSFVISLPEGNGRERPAAATPHAGGGNLPSHVLVNYKAYPLPSRMLYLGARPETPPSGEGIGFIEIQDPELGGLITISRRGQGYVLEKGGTGSVRVNGEPPGKEERSLRLGDRINVVNSGVNIQLIQVE